MSAWLSMRCVRIAMFLLLSLAGANLALAQTGGTGILRGQVADDTGGAIPNAPVRVTGPSGQVQSATTGRDGVYEVRDLAPGQYKVDVNVTGFAPFTNAAVNIVAGQTQQLNVVLAVAEQQEKVTVTDEAVAVDTSPSNNASSVVLTEKELDALPDDPDELQADLEALAGPSAGPNGGQMYIDGFTAGQLPPKSSIREIRINQNPFSAEFDKVGYGRIQIFTKPGTNQWHGQVSVNRNQADFNSPNPFSTTGAGFDSTQLEGNIGGPLSKRASVFFNVDHRDIADQSIVVATDVDPTTFQQVAADATIPAARTRLNIGPRLDYQLTGTNTLSVRYQYFYNSQTNNGIGGLDLGSMGYNAKNTEQTVQISDDQIIGSKVINETRFQFLNQAQNQNPLNLTPSVTVPGAFNGGGSNGGLLTDLQRHYEVQNYTSVALAKHFIRFGIRLRAVNDANSSTSGFNGAFTFPSLTVYANTLQNGVSPGTGPSQFIFTTGLPASNVTMVDVGPYVEDDWRIRPNITFSYGLRFEGQDHINNHADWAPRVAVAWGIGRGKATPKTVLRAGWGIFYDRFAENQILQAERLNGITQQQYVIAQPNFFCPNSLSSCPSASTIESEATSVPTIYQIAPNLHAPMMMQTAVTVERQLTKSANLSVSYLNSRGSDQLLTDNVNSPVLPGTMTPASVANGGVYPNGIAENIYQYQSTGIFRQNQLIMNTTIRAGTKLQLNAYYALNYANSDTSGAGFFPSNPYNLLADYGRAAFDVRSKVFFGGTVGLPWGLRLSPFMTAQSGTPFNVTLSQDLIGSSQFNQRPGFVSNATCATTTLMGATDYCTPVGTFDSAGATGSESLLPINFLTGPGQFSLNIRLAKVFTFGKAPAGADRPRGQGGGGPGGGGGGRPGGGGFGAPRGPGGGGGVGAAAAGRYSITASVNARNAFNNVNLGTPIGTLNSKSFDQSIGLAGGGNGGPGFGGASNAANRQIYLQLTFGF